MSNSSANCTYMKATSDGAWGKDKPIDYALPLLIIQLCLVLFFSRVFAFILKPLRQPRVIAEILGGIVLGRSCMGQIPGFTNAIFPKKSLTVLTTVANLGLLYFLFTIGLELDVRSLKKIGKSVLFIAIIGILLPFALGVGTSFAAQAILNLSSPFGPFCVFMGVAMSITAFPVLARILAERKLLTTDVGQVAMSAAAVNDVVAWILLALAVALATPDASATVVVWILLCGVGFVTFMLLAVRPLMAYACRHIVDNEPVPEWLVAVTFVGVLISAFITDTIGIHGIFGAFVFGLCVPQDGPFSTLVLEKLEDFTTIVLLPLYFASSGLAVNFQSISSGSVGLLFLVIATACVGKIGGTMGSALLSRLPWRKSLVLGILMNTKGLVELIVLNIGLEKKVINDELYTIMVIMALVTTFMTTPLVMLLYAPARERRAHIKTKVEQLSDGADELRMLVCVHGMHNIPGMLNLTEVSRGTRRRPLRVFLMHLMELSERSSAIVMVTRVRKDGRPYWNKDVERKGEDQVVVAFQAYAELSRVAVQPLTCISMFDNMHEDICEVAAEKRTSLIVVPYHRATRPDGTEVSVSHGFQSVNRKLLRSAPCSVALLVDRGLGGFSQISPGNVEKRVAVLFFGGPDDREALTVARRMVEHPGVTLHVIHFKPTAEASIALEIEQQQQQQVLPDASASSSMKAQHEAALMTSFVVPMDKSELEQMEKHDQTALAPILETATDHSDPPMAVEEPSDVSDESSGEQPQQQQQQHQRTVQGKQKVRYEVREVDDPTSALLPLEKEDFNLIIVGRGRRAPLLLARMASQRSPYRFYYHSHGVGGTVHGDAAGHGSNSELGPVGEMLMASDLKASILVVQQHDAAMMRSHEKTNVGGRSSKGKA